MALVMALVKRSRPTRRKKKSALPSKNTVSKIRTLAARTRKSKAPASRRTPKNTDDKLVRQYHELVEKKLRGIATSNDLAELQQVTAAIQEIERSHTARFEAALDQRHAGMMEKLESLASELRGFSAAARR